ncbi:MaoC family dehydratase N-terminal domain-containing protein [Mycobacterium senriense]|uniref:Mesaconyl-C(4)-CoA hydratase n=1 Tax=Mycobacterium senriense TaxID=2775496 RepID=A0ABM7SPQ3_9MYCO|nr:mesaconyl-C(4)-CoA hydratase [Mycobacterium senriense]
MSHSALVIDSRWEPHTVREDVVVDAGRVAALSALFDDSNPAPLPGDELPPLWHWVALPQWCSSSALSSDGHPRRGSFLPPIDLPRRMFAGGEIELHAALTVGRVIRRESWVDSVEEKTGRSGSLVIVRVTTHLYNDHSDLAVVERQNLIFREAASQTSGGSDPADAAIMPPTPSPLRRTGEWEWEFETDPSLLMRFSAVTANAHRIHYDWPYATRVEGYPGLVVHGPLVTLALAEIVRLETPDAGVHRVRHRNVAPLFCGQSAQLKRLASDSPSVALSATGDDGRDRATVDIELR